MCHSINIYDFKDSAVGQLVHQLLIAHLVFYVGHEDLVSMHPFQLMLQQLVAHLVCYVGYEELFMHSFHVVLLLPPFYERAYLTHLHKHMRVMMVHDINYAWSDALAYQFQHHRH